MRADISTNIPYFTDLANFYISRDVRAAEFVGIRVRDSDLQIVGESLYLIWELMTNLLKF